MDPFTSVDLIEPGLGMAAGAALLWFPRKHRRSAQRAHAARQAELEAGAPESYFEEKRALHAYRPARADRSWQLLGAVLFLLAAFQLYTLLDF